MPTVEPTDRTREYRFRNYIRSVDVRVDSYWKPRSVADIVWIVQHAEAEKRHVHAVGAAYSFQDLWTTQAPVTLHAPETEDWIVDLGRLGHILPGLVEQKPGSPLTAAWERAQFGDGADKLVHVEVGARLFDLNKKLMEMGLALPTMGGAQGQHLAGAFSTSTHGSDWRLPPLCDFVQAVHLVTTGGRELWIESASHPVTDSDDGLRKAIHAGPQLEIIRDDELLAAVQVGFGRFGIIYSVVLKVTRAFRLMELADELPWRKVADALAAGVGRYDGTPFGKIDALLQHAPSDIEGKPEEYRYFDLVLNPRKRESCWVRRRWVTTNRMDLNVWASANPLCCPGVANALLAACAIALHGHAAGVAAIPIYGIFKSIEINARATELETKAATEPHLSGGEALAMALNAIWASQMGNELGGLIDEITQMAIGEQMNKAKKGRRGPNWVISAGRDDPKALGDCYRGNSIEVVFGLQTRAYIDFIDKVLSEAGKQLHAGYMAVRFTHRSGAVLSMHTRHEVNCSIEITSLRGVSGNAKWLAWVEETAVAMGARPHWGQQNSLKAAQVAHLYEGDLARWKKQLARVTGTNTTFSNNYTRQRGLEP